MNAYKFSNHFSIDNVTGIMWLLSGISFVVLSLYINEVIVLAIVFLGVYIFLNIRKPLIIEKIGNIAVDSKRASVLSIESQFTSLLLAIFAPVLGFIADTYSIAMMLFLVGVTMMVIYFLNLFLITKPLKGKKV
jgi:MFS-type transporter involved in bile tolerance (Atg22 family)